MFLEKEKNQSEDAGNDPKRPMGKKKAKATQQSKKRRLDKDDDEGEKVPMEAPLSRERIDLDRSHFNVLERAEDMTIWIEISPLTLAHALNFLKTCRRRS